MQNTRLLNVDGHTMAALAYNEDKNGIPAIFIHPFATSIAFWEPVQIPLIKNNLPWYSLSLPGHYPGHFKPGFTLAHMTAENLAAIVHGAITQLVGDSPFIISGVSGGAFMALNVTCHYPEQIAGMVSISGFAYGDWIRQLQPLRVRIAYPIVMTLYHRFLSRSVHSFRKASYKNIFDLDKTRTTNPDLDTFIDAVYADYTKLSGRMLSLYSRSLPDMDIRDKLPRIKSPVLVLNGEKDPIIPPRQSQIILDHLPNAEHIEFKGVGHFPMWENPSAYQHVMSVWFQRGFA